MDEVRVGRGSYELYDSQKSGNLSSGEPRSAQGMAPGCPGLPQDLQQMLEEKDKELRDRKSREDNLLQIISELRSGQNMSHSGGVGDGPFINAEGASGSPTNDTVGENVKDAHLKHLQRQVTILQASLYKSEGWTTRVEEARREKDKALDSLRAVSAELDTTKEEKKKQQQELKDLVQKHTVLQLKLDSTRRELEAEKRHERCQAQNSRLQEELSVARAQLETLKESVSRLSQENKTLNQKVQSTASGQGSKGTNSSNMECNQELEYLHAVVDQLKTTVLEQRSFLVTMKPPSLASESMSSRSERASSQGPSWPIKEPHLMTRSRSSRQSDSSPFSDSDLSGQQSSELQSDKMAASAGPSVMAAQLSAPRSSSPNARDVYHVINGAAPRLTAGPDGAFAGMRVFPSHSGPTPAEQLVTIGLPHKSSANPEGQDVQPQLAALTRQAQQSAGDGHFLVPVTALERKKAQLQPQVSAPVRKVSQSEVLARRANSDATVLDKTRSKTDVLLRQADRSRPGVEGKTYPQWMLNNSGQLVSPNVATMANTFQTAIGTQASVAVGATGYEAALESPAQYNLVGNAMRQTVFQQRVQNPPVSPSHLAQQQQLQQQQQQLQQQQQQQQQLQQQQLRRQPGLQSADTVHLINNDMMGGGRMLHVSDAQPKAREASPSASTSPMVFQTANSGSPVLAQSPADPAPQQYESEVNHPQTPQLNADRVCPVCTRNYDQLSMEEFQTHVFECFDDENAPETMKPVEEAGLDRMCPMCNTKFGRETTQAEYEKHVHSHFGEEGPGENFEVLYP